MLFRKVAYFEKIFAFFKIRNYSRIKIYLYYKMKNKKSLCDKGGGNKGFTTVWELKHGISYSTCIFNSKLHNFKFYTIKYKTSIISNKTVWKLQLKLLLLLN